MATDSVKNIIINVKSNTQGIENLQKEVDKLQKENAEMAKSFKDANKKMNDGLKDTGKSAGILSDQMKNLGNVIAGAFTIGAMVQFTKQVFDTRAEFQKLEAVLTNTLGSNSKAQLAMAQIQKFASQTPFSVVELTQSFVKLANQGFKPTLNEMRKLGDLASSTGKSFDQLTEAIIDAQTGEFERLKEFGIRASKEGDKVTFTFKGVKQQVDFTSEAMRGYILSLGDVVGVSGSMEAISKTLGGQLSNLGDAWDSLMNIMGQQSEGVMSNTLAFMSEMVSKAGYVIAGLDDLTKATKLTFGDEMQNNAQKMFDTIVKGGKSETDAISEVIKYYYDLTTQKINAQQATKDELEQLGTVGRAWYKEHAKLLEGVIAQYDGEIDALRELLRIIPSLKKTIDDVNESEQDNIGTVGWLKEQIKEITQSIDGMQIGSVELAEALKLLEQRQLELSNALHPVNRELNKQYQQMTLLEAKSVDLSKSQQKMLDNGGLGMSEKEIEDYYKKLYGIDTSKGVSFSSETDKEMDAILEARQLAMAETINMAQTLADTLFEIQKNRLDKETEYEKAILKARLDNNEITQQEYENQMRSVMLKQWQREKKMAEAQILIAGAVASARVWSEANGDFYTKLILQAVVAGETAGQLAIVASQSPPQFEKGGLIGGKLHRDGGTIIEAEKGEYVINRKRTSQHKDIIDQINNGNVEKYIAETYIYPALQQQRMDIVRDNTLAENIAQSIATHNSFNDGRMVAWLGRLDKSTHQQTNQIVGALKQTRKDMRNV